MLILFVGIAVFSMVKYVSELKERHRLQDSLTQAQDRIAALAQEKQNLLQDLRKEKNLKEQLEAKNLRFRSYLKASKDRIMRLFRDNSQTRKELEETGARLSVLKAENRALVDSRKRLYLENEQFRLKLSSVEELKKAMQELKTGNRQESYLMMDGNQGFLFKDGRSTFSEKIKIEVIPAQTKK